MNACKQLYMIEREMCNRSGDAKRVAWYDWILSNGKEFTGRKLSKEEEKDLYIRLGHPLYKMGKCYYNSQLVACDGKYSYFEGYATSEGLGLPLEHGFNVCDGKVFDTTWSDGAEYFGVEIPVEFVRLWLLEEKSANQLIGRYFVEVVLKCLTDC